MAEFEIKNDDIDFALYMLPPEEKARIVKADAVVQRMKDLSTGKAATEGLRLPWERWRNVVRYVRPGTSLWTGKTFHGKSQLLKQLMLSAVACGERICIASMEETPEQTLLDIARMAAMSPAPDDDRIEVFCGWCRDRLYCYDQQGLVKPERILGVMNYAAKELGVTHFVLDSWMRMDMASDDYDGQRVFVNLLGMYARANNLHVHVVAHGRKGKGRDDGPMGSEDVRGSGDIINQFDKIHIAWRNTVARHERPGGAGGGEPDAALIIEKQSRCRPNWIGRIPLWYHEDSGQFLAERDGKPIEYIRGLAAPAATQEMF